MLLRRAATHLLLSGAIDGEVFAGVVRGREVGNGGGAHEEQRLAVVSACGVLRSSVVAHVVLLVVVLDHRAPFLLVSSLPQHLEVKREPVGAPDSKCVCAK